ncbi:MAG: NrdR transcriptional repressor [Sodalis sp. Fle]|nr:MAG: NrdR transcriptional repressor [Sodalis sp. Fle]
MHCPFCSAFDTKVMDFLLIGERTQVLCGRECIICSKYFINFEVVELVLHRRIKNNDVYKLFYEDKLRCGLLKRYKNVRSNPMISRYL